jgi:hypothetical protein
VAMAPTMTMTMAQPSALVPQQYMLDYSSYGMASQDMMYPAFQQGGNTAGACAPPALHRLHSTHSCHRQQTCSWCTTRSRFRTAWWAWSSA